MNVGIVLAGGVGRRFGGNMPKQYQTINGKEVIAYVIDAFRHSSLTDEILIVANEQYVEYLQDKYKLNTIKGGVERNETVFNAICFVKEHYGADAKVIFADSARPMLTPEYVDKVFVLLDKYDAVITVAKITDSLFELGNSLVDREQYRLIQTPEAFKLQALNDFNKNGSATAILEQCKSNKMYFCDELNNNFKITYPQDLLVAGALLKETV